MLLMLLAAAATAGAEPPATYAKPDLLVSAATLTDAEKRKKFTIVDMRGDAAYRDGHVPGSVNARTGPWSRAVNEGKADAAFWTKEFAALGMHRDIPVVVVAEDVREGCRVWWLLKIGGVPDARLLDGGWKAYLAAKGEVDKKPFENPGALMEWKADPARLATKEVVLSSLKDKVAQIVDARSVAEFSGEQAMAKRGGHVPGAERLEWSDLLDGKTKTFKSAEELKALITAHKLDLDKPCVTYCQSGLRASVVAFGLELMGAKDVKNYYKSWSEWGNDAETPVEKK
jgi:thiosulfate/3-mercaptopyruvate sulfurtransferase